VKCVLSCAVKKEYLHDCHNVQARIRQAQHLSDTQKLNQLLVSVFNKAIIRLYNFCRKPNVLAFLSIAYSDKIFYNLIMAE